MSKTNIEKAIEKQIKANKDAARIEQRRQEASEIVNSQPTLSGMRIIDEDSEKVLEAILEQYDGNEDNYIDFKEETLSRPLAESIALQYTKLKMYGLISSIQAYWGGAVITLSKDDEDICKNHGCSGYCGTENSRHYHRDSGKGKLHSGGAVSGICDWLQHILCCHGKFPQFDHPAGRGRCLHRAVSSDRNAARGDRYRRP